MNDPRSAVTSATMPKLMRTPAAATRAARAWNAARVAVGSWVRRVAAPGPSSGSRATIPPSWSIAVSTGSPGSALSSAEVAASWAVDATLSPMKMTPATPVPSIVVRIGPVSVPPTCTISRLAIFCSSVIASSRAST